MARPASASTDSVTYMAPRERIGIVPGIAGDFLDLLPLPLPLRGIGRDRQPAVEIPPYPLKARRQRAADPDQRPAGAIGRRREHAAIDLPQPVPVDRVSRPQRPRKPDAFKQSTNALFERHASRREFAPDIRNIRRDADADDEAAFGDLVEGRKLVREKHRIAHRRQQHRGADLDPRQPGSDSRKQSQRIVARPRQQRVADPDRN